MVEANPAVRLRSSRRSVVAAKPVRSSRGEEEHGQGDEDEELPDEEQEGNDEEEIEDEEEEEEDGGPPSRRGGRRKDDRPVKRQRLDDGHDENEERVQGQEPTYPVGAIVRIKLKNFITYDAVEFRPGPNLNMIIGPNGTGKSSLVCAIALGLAGRPDALGRQKSLQDFIKDGQEKAYIEIELKGRGKGRNVIVRRIFKKGTANANMWKLNGEHSTEKNVKEKMASMHVQVDNLCSFLPQEKVSEFAQMNPPELLRETERSAGNAKLSEWHAELVSMRNEEKKLEASAATTRAEFENLERRHALMQRDVERFREREEVLRNIAIIETKIPQVKYVQLRAEAYGAHEKWKQLRIAFREVENRTAPLLAQQDEKKEELRELKDKVKEYTREYSEMLTNGVKGRNDALDAAETETNDLYSQLSLIRRREEEHRKKRQEQVTKIAQTQAKVRQLETALIESGILSEDGETQGEVGGELAELSARIEGKNQELRKLAEKSDTIRQANTDLCREAQHLRTQRDRKMSELENFDSVRNQKLELIKREAKDVYDAIMWLRDNQGLFEKKVYEPVVLEINVKDPRYSEAVETCLGRGNMLMFVTLTKKDYDTFADEMIDKRKMRINIVMMADNVLKTPPHTKEELQRCGFEGTIPDYIEGPPDVLHALCASANIHMIPVAAKEIPLANHRLLEDRTSVGTYISGPMRYAIRRAYGTSSVNASKMRPARFLQSSVDMSLKAALEQELDQVHTQLEDVQRRITAIRADDDKVRAQDAKLRADKTALNERKKEIHQQRKKYDNAKADLEILEMRLKNMDDTAPASSEEEEASTKKEIRKLALRRAGIAVELEKAYKEAADIFLKRTLADLRQMTLSAQILQGDRDIADAMQEKEAAKLEMDDAQTAFKAIVTRRDDVKAEWKAAMDKHSGTITAEMYETYADLDVDALEQLLAEQQARADTINQTDAGIIEEFERRSAELERLRQKLDTDAGKLNERTAQIQRIKNKWEPELRALVERISAGFATAFEKIGCAGEVKLSTHEDYDKWGIDILVKFRDTERLNQLTGQRQSGGERSVSTILYLMALQSLSHTPFRVVDEINQGMDPRNERMVHGEMVRAACQMGTSQYFLITPKLLPDLEYHERMRVLCVFNGPDTPEKLDARRYLERRMAVRAA
ncbi:uncharacterized protein EV422DRAFT_368077 [Fimicolochytrium jonesii]|uniref:uncharacterized protein n=1 Tax=Fimicolochytrium jonesii TaxID=1396493 RepID=UPI0022FE61C8|nr:uncharacterized protein EV422DRAFT_368077 [Fimicolochytrium jonesii]KAI8823741.1 hypothetical protein EV422DRAFT_368077 [Fimicolochytrium jonesii]